MNAHTLGEKRRKICYPQATYGEKIRHLETSIFRLFGPPKIGHCLPSFPLVLEPSFPLARVLVARKAATLSVREALEVFFFQGGTELLGISHPFLIVGPLLRECISRLVSASHHSY